MLDDYRDKQSIAYNVMVNEIKKQQLSHAYLIDENNYANAMDMVMAFVAAILSEGLNDLEKEKLIRRIYDNNYPEFKIIEPDGMFIRKKQILDLQQEFSLEAFEGDKRIYIIHDADKMRSETANSMLKFLEEPSNNIIAILMTNNYNGMLSTIISRCQVIKMSNDNSSINDEYLNLAVDFVSEIEKNGVKAILKIQEILFDKISSKEREKLIIFFDKVIDIYYDIMKISLNSKKIKYNKFVDLFSSFALKTSSDIILEKINYLVLAKENIKYNVNNNLLFDSIIVNLGGKYEGSWS